MISRSDLPQLTESVLKEKGIPYESLVITPSSITPMQVDRLPFNDDKYLSRYTKITTNTYKPLVVDQDYKLIDGHHRYDIIQRTKMQSVRVLRIDLTFKEVIELFKNNT